MEQYIGTKIINAMPMNKQDYNDLRGWELPEDENGSDEGYLVEYPNGGQQNHPNYLGYISWSPKQQFEDAYMRSDGISFGLAIEAMKKGWQVCRDGWNGKDMFVFLVPGSEFKVNREPLLGIYPEGTDITYGAHIDIKAVDGSIRPWVASQSDMLATDWRLVLPF